MIEENYGTAQRQMIEDIAAHASFAQKHLGKKTLDRRVLDAMAQIPRHEFVPVELRSFAYEDTPLPIGYGKTISQPFIVALMTDLLDLRPDDIVLEVGTGLGYQTAILAELAGTIYSLDIIEELSAEADRRLQQHGYSNFNTRVGDGYLGWPDHAPFDKVIVTAAPDLIPPPLIEQLKPGGKMVIPTGTPDAQQLMLVRKTAEGRLETEDILPVRFSLLESDNVIGGTV